MTFGVKGQSKGTDSYNVCLTILNRMGFCPLHICGGSYALKGFRGQ